MLYYNINNRRYKMRIEEAACMEYTFFLKKFGFYYRPYGEEKWTRLPFCFSYNQAHKKVVEIQLKKMFGEN